MVNRACLILLVVLSACNLAINVDHNNESGNSMLVLFDAIVFNCRPIGNVIFDSGPGEHFLGGMAGLSCDWRLVDEKITQNQKDRIFRN